MTRGIGIRTWRNTYLTGSRPLFDLVIRDAHVDRVLAATGERPPRTRSQRARGAARRLRPWFWPSITDAESWAVSSEAVGWQPSAYIVKEPRRLLRRLLDTTSREQSVLDLGCNSGSHLDLMRKAGFQVLYGVDAGREALALFSSTFPETYELADVEHDLFQRYLRRRPDRSVDVLHSNGATLELVHPSFPIVSEICRVTRHRVLVDIQERGHSYPRDYIAQFEHHGFRLVYCERPVDLVEGTSLLEFERIRPATG